MKEIKDFCVSSNANGFDEFLKVLKEYFKLHLSGRTQKYYGVEDGIFSMWSSIPNVIEVAPQEAIALLTGKQLTEREKPCANCKETIAECACMRNICVKCNKPVGNITFSHCDKCFDILHSEPTQESVKERNGDPSMDEMIQLVEQLESDKFHLQQQLKEAKELLEKTTSFCEDENMYPTVYHSINQFLTRNK